MTWLNRRSTVSGLAALGSLAFGARATCGAGATPTARTVVERIKAQCASQGVEWSAQTGDTFKTGDPDAAVAGIVCTFMGTLDVLHRSVRAGANLIISHEPIFYNHRDEVGALAGDPVYRSKIDFLHSHQLVVWRFHDHLHQLVPDPINAALIDRLQWRSALAADSTEFQITFARQPVRLADLVAEISARLPSRSVRFVGNPDQKVTRIGLTGHFIADVIGTLSNCDVALAPEAREWDCVEYVRDAVALGQNKALILIAHERGEEDGMARCADWLRPLVPEVPVTFIATGEPFRAPVFG